MNLKLKALCPNPSGTAKEQRIDLGNGSEVVYIPRFLGFDEACKLFNYLNKDIPWMRPTIRVFGKPFVQVSLSSISTRLFLIIETENG